MRLTMFVYDNNGELLNTIERHIFSSKDAKGLVREIEDTTGCAVGYCIEKSPADDFVVALEELSNSYEDNREFVDSLCEIYGLASIDEVAAKARELL